MWEKPGFGKTTLLADFSSRYPGRCLWYRLDETDGDWITMANYLIAAGRPWTASRPQDRHAAHADHGRAPVKKCGFEQSD